MWPVWGEIPKSSGGSDSATENQSQQPPLTLFKRENLVLDALTNFIPMPGPPPKRENDDWAKLDDNVLHSVQCLELVRQTGQEAELSEALVQLQREDEKIIPCKRRRRSPSDGAKPIIVNVEGIDAQVCRDVTKRAVTALLAHTGCHSARTSVLETLTDVTKNFIYNIGLQLSHRRANQSPESALMESGIGSLDEIASYYEERVLAHRANMEAAVQKLRQSPLSEPMPPSQEEETAVEIHFPAGSEEMETSLSTGLQMLITMESGIE
ncbi:Hypothetical predicted protein [Cloeon dipterum]|uniref:Bromodomain associated domain-containing protein n=1 Tax=Cloeon dipterum TaxID=197152 RepID=A0A8S1BNL2_9INSE|nr:Hypothetical predicted protein [Cloeon dipterum]